MTDGGWKPRCVEDTIDDGVHPAVARMRAQCSLTALAPSLDVLSKLGFSTNSLAPVEKRHALKSPEEWDALEKAKAKREKKERKQKKKEKKDKKKDKKEKKKKDKKKKKKKSSSSSSSSSDGSSSSSSSSKGKSKKKAKKDKKEKEEKKSKEPQASEKEPEPAAAAQVPSDDEVEGSSPERGSPKKQKISSTEAPGRPASSAASAPVVDEPPPEHVQVASALERLDFSVLDRAVASLNAGSAAGEMIASAIAKITPHSVDKEGATKTALGRGGVVRPLVNLLRASTLGVQTQATRALHNLTSKSAENKALVVEAGAIMPLLALLKSGAPTVKEQASGVLRNLAGGSQETKADLAACGARDLVAALQGSSPAVQSNISVVLYNLANNSPERRNSISIAGAMPALVAVLKQGVPEAQREAADTLRILVAGEVRNCMAVVGEGVAQPLATMLRADAPPKLRQQANLLCKHLREFGGSGVKAALDQLPRL